MKIFTLAIVLSFAIAGCDKSTKYNKQIDGIWNPVSLKIADITGIGYYAETSGAIHFQKDGKKSKSGTYDIELNYVLKGTPYTFIETGTYTLDDNNMLRQISNGPENKSIINYANKEDLEFEIPNLNNQRFLFVLKRD